MKLRKLNLNTRKTFCHGYIWDGNVAEHAHPYPSMTMPNGLDLYEENKSIEGLVNVPLVQYQ